jgi:uroporphyrin-III C-methyltransferase
MKVILVGAGPGDEGLITLKGVEAIKNADVIVYDDLIGEKLLKYAKTGSELIYVGKRK